MADHTNSELGVWAYIRKQAGLALRACLNAPTQLLCAPKVLLKYSDLCMFLFIAPRHM